MVVGLGVLFHFVHGVMLVFLGCGCGCMLGVFWVFTSWLFWGCFLLGVRGMSKFFCWVKNQKIRVRCFLRVVLEPALFLRDGCLLYSSWDDRQEWFRRHFYSGVYSQRYTPEDIVMRTIRMTITYGAILTQIIALHIQLTINSCPKLLPLHLRKEKHVVTHPLLKQTCVYCVVVL